MQFRLWDIISPLLLGHLELLGYNYEVRWVLRDADTGSVSFTDTWPLARVLFRTADDFGCEEWEWLLRHKGLTPWELFGHYRWDYWMKE